MKTLKKPSTNTGANSAPIAFAVLAGFGLGVAVAMNQKKLTAVGTLTAKKIEPAIDGAKSKFGKAVEAVVTRGGDIIMNFGEAVDQARKQRLQRDRNIGLVHPQHSGESDGDRLRAAG